MGPEHSLTACTTDIWGPIVLCCGGLSGALRMFSSIPGLHPSDVKCINTHARNPVVTIKNVCRHCQMTMLPPPWRTTELEALTDQTGEGLKSRPVRLDITVGSTLFIKRSIEAILILGGNRSIHSWVDEWAMKPGTGK